MVRKSDEYFTHGGNGCQVRTDTSEIHERILRHHTRSELWKEITGQCWGTPPLEPRGKKKKRNHQKYAPGPKCKSSHEYQTSGAHMEIV